MRSCRLAVAALVLAFVAGPAVAQVTDSVPNRNKSAAAEAVATSPQADPKAETIPIQVSQVPEPGSILLLSGTLAAGGWVTYWRRKWRADPAANDPTPQP